MTAPEDMHLSPNRSIAVIGGGPAGLIAAELLARAGARVTVYDQMASLGRKFLMAGRGGLVGGLGRALSRLAQRAGGLRRVGLGHLLRLA